MTSPSHGEDQGFNKPLGRQTPKRLRKNLRIVHETPFRPIKALSKRRWAHRLRLRNSKLSAGLPAPLRFVQLRFSFLAKESLINQPQHIQYIQGPWSSGYDVCLTKPFCWGKSACGKETQGASKCRRSLVRLRPDPCGCPKSIEIYKYSFIF